MKHVAAQKSTLIMSKCFNNSNRVLLVQVVSRQQIYYGIIVGVGKVSGELALQYILSVLMFGLI